MEGMNWTVEGESGVGCGWPVQQLPKKGQKMGPLFRMDDLPSARSALLNAIVASTPFGDYCSFWDLHLKVCGGFFSLISSNGVFFLLRR